jgi:hypothetical protein
MKRLIKVVSVKIRADQQRTGKESLAAKDGKDRRGVRLETIHGKQALHGFISSKNLAQVWIRQWLGGGERNDNVLDCPTMEFPWRD